MAGGFLTMKSRLMASGIHLLISAVVISVFMLVVYFIWYPYPYYRIHSTIDVVKITLGVDLVLGPLITLLIFNTQKPRTVLARDISVIILFQISALLWGIHVTHKMHPLFLVFQQKTFYSVIKQDIDMDRLSKNVSAPGFFQRPKMVYMEPMETKDKVRVFLGMLNKDGRDMMFQASLYKPFSDNNIEDVLAQALDKSRWLNQPVQQKKIDTFLGLHGGVAEDYAFYPIVSGDYKGTLVFKRSDFSIIGLIDSKF